MAECATVQLRVAEAAASIDTARTILLRDVDARRSSCGPATSARPRSNGSGSRGTASPRLRRGDQTIADKAAFVTSVGRRHGMPQISPRSSPERRSAFRRFCCRLRIVALRSCSPRQGFRPGLPFAVGRIPAAPRLATPIVQRLRPRFDEVLRGLGGADDR
ncbi:hypothetical protein ACIQW5_10725 [Methylorubrum thiocyanatum]|uniref:hypothetical protein n=1 Tax=Methylorubrum thiocyanatum TaxID=47958 RepID=UPI00383AF49F